VGSVELLDVEVVVHIVNTGQERLYICLLWLPGLLFDITQAWDLSFYMAGIWIVMSGVFVGLIPTSRNRVLCGSRSLQIDVERDKSSNA